MKHRNQNRMIPSRKRLWGRETVLFSVLLVVWHLVLVALGSSALAAEVPRAAEQIFKVTGAELFSRAAEGKVLSTIGTDTLVVDFGGIPVQVDSEHLVLRSGKETATGFPQTIAAVRVKEVKDHLAKVQVLWADEQPQPGDLVKGSSRTILFLAPTTDLAKQPGIPGPLVDQTLILAAKESPSVKVVPIDEKPNPDELAQRLKKEKEVGFLLEPVLMPEDRAVTLIANIRSVFSGQLIRAYSALLEAKPLEAKPKEQSASTPRVLGKAEEPAKKLKANEKPASAERASVSRSQAGEAPTKRPAPDLQTLEERVRKLEEGEPAIKRPGPEGTETEKQLATELREPLMAIVAADLEGDGKPELVGITPTSVIAYRWSGRRFVEIATWPVQIRFIQYLYVEAADINENGRDEVFVTAIENIPEKITFRTSLRSFVLELKDKRLTLVAEDLPYFLRVLQRPDQKPLLLAQRLGIYEPFDGPVLQMAWNGRRYAEAGPFPLTASGLNLYDFSLVEVGGLKELATLTTPTWSTNQWFLRISVPGGGTLYEGKERLGEVEHLGFYQTPRDIRPASGLSKIGGPTPEGTAASHILPRRILVTRPLFEDGEVELVTVANTTKYGFQLFSQQNASSAIAYVRNGNTYAKSWETAPVEGKGRDVAVADFDGDEKRDVVLLTSGKEKQSSTLYLFFSARKASSEQAPMLDPERKGGIGRKLDVSSGQIGRNDPQGPTRKEEE